jgi:integrase
MKRAALVGSVTFNRRFGTWVYLWWENGKRRSRTIGTVEDFPTKEAAWQAARNERTQPPKPSAGNLKTLVMQYRDERMPKRQSTRRGYNIWLDNHILPKWGASPVSFLQARPVELWLRSVPVSQKSKLHIRGMLSILWDYAMWRGDVPTQRNPMELVRIKGANKRLRKPRSLAAEEFHALMETLGKDIRSRTMLLLAVSFGLRISEVLGLKWKDVDWLAKTIRIERGVVKQIVDEVKSSYSAGSMLIADVLLESVKQWKQTTQFSGAEDWMFASPVKLGRQPLSYTHVWNTLDRTAKKAGIGHVSSHAFRHTYRTWLDSVGTPVGVQQKLMRHSDIRTTMNIYGDAVTDDLRTASHRVARMALAVT